MSNVSSDFDAGDAGVASDDAAVLASLTDNADLGDAAAEDAAPAAPTFAAMNLPREIEAALEDMGYFHPTPVQAAVYEKVMEGKDLMVQVLLDSLVALPESPSLLAARDAIILALADHLDAARITSAEHQAKRRALLKVFFDFGMGPDASADGVTLAFVQADGPPDLVPLPA